MHLFYTLILIFVLSVTVESSAPSNDVVEVRQRQASVDENIGIMLSSHYRGRYTLSFYNNAIAEDGESAFVQDKQHLTSVPIRLSKLTKLAKLSLSFNRIGHFPPAMSHLENLTHLRLSHNRLPSFPFSIQKLPKLKVLDLSYNYIDIIPDWVNNFYDLTYLNVTFNNIPTLPINILHLPSLEFLHLKGKEPDDQLVSMIKEFDPQRQKIEDNPNLDLSQGKDRDMVMVLYNRGVVVFCFN